MEELSIAASLKTINELVCVHRLLPACKRSISSGSYHQEIRDLIPGDAPATYGLAIKVHNGSLWDGLSQADTVMSL